ncbi:MAG: HAMP domain-containing histidine kinase [Streptococcus salivarius]|nr:HAMP domain-containing histidine kinase [Streptococcus salivarius]
MFSKMKNQTKQLSIISKVTLWYTVFVSLLFIVMFVASFIISGTWSDYESRSELEQETVELSTDLDDFESFDDGIYFALYNQNKEFEKGALPSDFDANASFKSGKLSTYSSSQMNYYYYDVYNAKKGKWIRGVRTASGLSKELTLFLISIAILAPISILGMEWVGRRILKRAFVPIKDVTQMAEEITESRDYTKRVSSSYKLSYVETTRLTKVFNDMISSVQSTFEKEKRFNQNVSHELRTPLSVILSESEFGSKYADSLEESKESHTIINRQAKLMKNMTEQILELSKTQKLNWNDLERLSLSSLISEYCQAQERKWAESAIDFKVAIEPNLWIKGEKLLVIRMLDNLLSNAMKFTRTSISITLERVDYQALLKVADDGIGISEDQLNKICDRFYQVEDSRNKSLNSGVGLGLSFVKDIAELHRAELDIQSKEDVGSSFMIRFPLCD